MKYNNIVKGRFVSRPNRFIAKVIINGKEETVHVKNTGRCKEILVSDAAVYLTKASGSQRKTQYDLIAVEKKTENRTILINIDSQIPNACAEEFLPHSGLFSENLTLKREVKYGNSRFDIFAHDGERRAFIEVKGVTLEKNGKALFPDAPTQRGIKHIKELIKAKNEGYEAYIIFIIQMDEVHSFSPDSETHPDFAFALKEAADSGVNILAYKSSVTPDSIEINSPVEVNLT